MRLCHCAGVPLNANSPGHVFQSPHVTFKLIGQIVVGHGYSIGPLANCQSSAVLGYAFKNRGRFCQVT
jgi:hypothetical protein